MKKKDIWISLAIIACSCLSILYYTQRRGYIKIDAGRSDAVLQLNSVCLINTTINTNADIKPSTIPARIYRPKLLSLSIKQDRNIWRIESRGPWGNLSKIKVRNNETTAIRIGPPFLIKPKVRKNKSMFYIDFDIIGQADEHYANSITKNNRIVTGAEIKILDEKGNELESGKFKYG